VAKYNKAVVDAVNQVAKTASQVETADGEESAAAAG
jgi:hypothetical protein